MSLRIYYLKINVSCEASVNFQHMPRLLWNLHVATASHALTMRFAKTRKPTRLKCCACHATWRRRSRRKSIAAATQNDFCHVMKHVWMSQSATPATRNEATRRLKPPKATPFAELAIGMAIRASRGRLRTVANSCGRLRTTRLRNVERTHPQPPDPHSETRTLATHSGKSRWIPKQWPFATIKHLLRSQSLKKHQAFFPTSPRKPTLEE